VADNELVVVPDEDDGGGRTGRRLHFSGRLFAGTSIPGSPLPLESRVEFEKKVPQNATEI